MHDCSQKRIQDFRPGIHDIHHIAERVVYLKALNKKSMQVHPWHLVEDSFNFPTPQKK